MNRADYHARRAGHWDGVARCWLKRKGLGGYYQRRLQRVYGFQVPPNSRVLELGCGFGDLLAGLRPGEGVGVDLSPAMVAQARARHPGLTFVCADAAGLELGRTFDVIIFSDLVNDLWDVQQVLETARRHAAPGARFVFNFYSRVWELPLRLAQALRLARPNLEQNWLTPGDMRNLMDLAGLEPIRHWMEFLLPLYIPILSALANRFLARIWPLRLLALANFMVARVRPGEGPVPGQRTVSVVVPARNEAGNIEAIFARVPEMGEWTELVFVEGHSRDGTYEAIAGEIARHPLRRCQLLRQQGVGKGDAVRLGFEKARGDLLMILDADLTVTPEDLPRFYEALASGKGELVNSVRLVYPREKQAMRFLNFLGNKFFSFAFSALLGQTIKDTLGGTKALDRERYRLIKENRAYFGNFDPFGDFDLIFGAAKLNLKIVDLPVRYRERAYGQTNIQRWRHGWLLLKMVAVAAGRIKFI